MTHAPRALQSKAYNERYYQEHVADNLDYLAYGDWQRDYGRWIVDSLSLRGASVLDVGCACGAVANGILEADALCVAGVDLCEEMIARGRKRFPRVELHVCDAANLHHFSDGVFDCIHHCCVAEHWPERLVPAILAELHRVSKPDVGLMYANWDTREVYDRQNRRDETEDATHCCVMPMAWWIEQYERAGWRPARADRVDALRAHPHWARRPNGEEGFRKFDWDFAVFLRA